LFKKMGDKVAEWEIIVTYGLLRKMEES
jgi:hypothetical protein